MIEERAHTFREREVEAHKNIVMRHDSVLNGHKFINKHAIPSHRNTHSDNCKQRTKACKQARVDDIYYQYVDF